MRKIIFTLICLMITAITYADENRLQKETEHFKYFSETGDNYQEIYDCFEEGHKKIVDDLSFVFEEKVNVNIYKSETEMKKIGGLQNSPSWLVGYYNPILNTVNIVDINNISLGRKEAKQIYIHEFIHYLTNKLDLINANNTWIHEGIAVYESGQLSGYGVYQTKISLKNGEVPKISEVRNSFNDGGKYYRWAGLFIEYIAQTYGIKEVGVILKNKSDIEKVLQKSEDEVFKEWLDYLKKTYETKKGINKVN